MPFTNPISDKGLERHRKFLEDRFGLRLEVRAKANRGRRSSLTPLGFIREYRFLRGGKEVAHHRFSPMLLNSYGQILRGVQYSDSWVDERYRGFGLFPVLAETGCRDLKKEGYRFGYAFPNQNNLVNLTKICGMKNLGACYFLVKPSRIRGILHRFHLNVPSWVDPFLQFPLNVAYRLNRLRQDRTLLVKELPAIPDAIEPLLREYRVSAPNYFVRTRDQVSWRYGHSDYLKLSCYDDQGKLVGFLIGRSDYKEGLNVAAIIDYYLDRSRDEKQILNALVVAFENHFSKSDIFTALISPHDPVRRQLYSLGYLRLNTERFSRSFWFLVKSFDNDTNLRLEELKTWHLTFYDSLDSF